MTSEKPLVAILMGSDSDLPVMTHAARVLKQFNIPFEIEITSAHRSPHRTSEYARSAAQRGLKVLIIGAGAAAALAGVMAAETTLPVIGVPMATSPLSGFDALLSTAMMPAGVPVATMAVGEAGARNAAVLAVQILALSDSALSTRLIEYKQELERSVREKSEKVKTEFKG
jgi:5-(carboxyamino)imidazole ribonucleotide mutase